MTSPGEPTRDDIPPDRDNDPSEAKDAPEAPPPTVPVDPEGEGPEHIPDPMPAELQHTTRADRAFEKSHPMEGEAPSG